MAKKWENEDIEYLKDNYSFKLNKEIGAYLNRSKAEINTKAFKLGLKKSEDFWKRKHKRQSIRMKFD